MSIKVLCTSPRDKRDIQCNKEQFIDKGRDILLNKYIEDKFKSVYCKLWAHKGSLLEYYLYMLVDILLGYYIFTYSNRCSTKILGLFTFKFKGVYTQL